ncbi:hypothetical protein L3V83_14085 [Thiotrichales bacterium 19X7-9]|nr:hypothetical protein [Thiotrichales bacterium 19X7-9]
MKCPFKINQCCYKKYLMAFACFVISVIVLSLVVKFAAWVLSLFSIDLYLNTVIVMFSSVTILIAAYKCCCKNKNCSENNHKLNACCDKQESNPENSTTSS